jgi:hypothetical protein
MYATPLTYFPLSFPPSPLPQMILSSIPLKPEDKRESRIFENNCQKNQSLETLELL